MFQPLLSKWDKRNKASLRGSGPNIFQGIAIFFMLNNVFQDQETKITGFKAIYSVCLNAPFGVISLCLFEWTAGNCAIIYNPCSAGWATYFNCFHCFFYSFYCFYCVLLFECNCAIIYNPCSAGWPTYFNCFHCVLSGFFCIYCVYCFSCFYCLSAIVR